MRKGPKLVFCGPSLPLADRVQAPDLVYLPPAAQGSVLAAVMRHEPSAILLLDGIFQSEPAVRHKEILWVIDRGIAVIGASSMGALRAAELWPYMRGVGLVYRWYRRCLLAPDDAVAVLHGPEELGYAPLTEALIDLRRTIRRARRDGLIDGGMEARLAKAAAQLGFRDRTLEAIVAGLAPQAGLRSALKRSWVGQKRADALQALNILLKDDSLLSGVRPSMEVTRTLHDDLCQFGFVKICNSVSSE